MDLKTVGTSLIVECTDMPGRNGALKLGTNSGKEPLMLWVVFMVSSGVITANKSGSPLMKRIQPEPGGSGI